MFLIRFHEDGSGSDTWKRGNRRTSRISACTIPRPTAQARKLYLKNGSASYFDAHQKPARNCFWPCDPTQAADT